jgi:hypothetical protein
MLHKETIAFSWETPEFEFKEKRKDWYWIVGAATIGLILLAIVLQNYLFAFLIVIGSFLMVTLAAKEPLSLPVEISEQGIKIYKENYNYDVLFGFWILYDKKEQPLLLIMSNGRISPIISLRIDENVVDVMVLREYLLGFIDEQEMKESLTNRIIQKIGF